MTPEPIVATGLFRAVMAAAGGCCQCRGECGQPHTGTENRCPREHSDRVRLMAAAADLSTPDREAAALPADRLRAWCPGCFTAAQRLARKTVNPDPTTDQCGLFDL